MAVPRPRREGQTGGMNHRSNYRGFGNSGGHVKPPKKGCAVLALLVLASPVIAAVGMVYYHTA